MRPGRGKAGRGGAGRGGAGSRAARAPPRKKKNHALTPAPPPHPLPHPLPPPPGLEQEHEWEASYSGAAGGILTVKSELGEPIHKVANRATQLWRELDA